MILLATVVPVWVPVELVAVALDSTRISE